MIQILRNSSGNTGWRLDTSGQVFQGGRLRHDNGQWEVEDELDDPADAIDYLDTSDFDSLIKALESQKAEEERLAAAATERNQRSASELKDFIDDLHTGSWDVMKQWGRKRFVKSSHSGRVCYVFRKKGGYRDWFFPVSDTDIRGLINGTHELRYTVGGSTAKIVKK